MQTRFTKEQLADPEIAAAEQILRKCVHCGFCTATCPTYVLLGDELDGPRGRIYLIKEMLEQNQPATATVVTHIDRCLSCLACMTTCPSGVHYQHLIDQARVHVERTYRRPFADRALRTLLAWVLPYPGRFRAALGLARLARPFARILPAQLRAMLALVPRRAQSLSLGDSSAPTSPNAAVRVPARASASPLPGGAAQRGPATAHGGAARRAPAGRRVALLAGCVQPVIEPAINAATERVLRRLGIDVVTVPGCCGSIVHHLGRAGQNVALAAALIERLHAEHAAHPLAAIVVNASGCGTHLKDYGYLFRTDTALAAKAAQVSALTRDIAEFLVDEVDGAVAAEVTAADDAPAVDGAAAGSETTTATTPPAPSAPRDLIVAYHSACSMQHGQGLDSVPRELLAKLGFDVREVPEGHLCCGSAGTYNMLQPEIAGRLRARKLANIARTGARVVATGNIGCMTQLRDPSALPIVHTVELVDWATGGPKPEGLGK